MSQTVCLVASTLSYLHGGGHMWVYLNWALGLKANGCRVIWLEYFDDRIPSEQLQYDISRLKERLKPYDLDMDVALTSLDGKPVSPEKLGNCIDLATAVKESDLLLNQYYAMHKNIVKQFRRSALLDIDPGLLQVWHSRKQINIAPHDIYFTIGETVGRSNALFPDGGIKWQYTAPCVSLEWWPVTMASKNSPFTTVTHWQMKLWEEQNGVLYKNDKRSGFLPFIEIPKYTLAPLELALLLGADEIEEKILLKQKGWRVIDSHSVTSTPAAYQKYIQQSYGEFSCVKPSCIQLQNAWISDRTICYLASGKPAIVQNTGPSNFLPDASGLFRFSNMEEAIKALKKSSSDYTQQCILARSLAEEYFDAKKVTYNVLQTALN